MNTGGANSNVLPGSVLSLEEMWVQVPHAATFLPRLSNR